MQVRSVLDGEPVWFGCDVRQRSELRRAGVLHHELYDWRAAIGVDFTMNKSLRIETGESRPASRWKGCCPLCPA